MTTPVAGAYGLRLPGADVGWLAVHGAGHWPEMSCVHDARPEAPQLWIDLEASELRLRADLPHSELVHPLLGRVAGHLALARGADGMHAGAIAGAAGAWAVVGDKRAGKSTLLAGLAAAGVPIVTDDVLILQDGRALSGPRCIDLRPDVRRFGLGIAVRPSDPRNRIALPPIGAEHPLAGVIHLEWSSAGTALDQLSRGEAVERLVRLQSTSGYPRDPRTLLDLATLPTLALRRPRSFSEFAASVGQLRDLVAGSSDAVGGGAVRAA